VLGFCFCNNEASACTTLLTCDSSGKESQRTLEQRKSYAKALVIFLRWIYLKGSATEPQTELLTYVYTFLSLSLSLYIIPNTRHLSIRVRGGAAGDLAA
jgi:hypothetical protein